MTSGPIRWARGRTTHPGPRRTLPSMIANAPTATSGANSASGETTADGWMPGDTGVMGAGLLPVAEAGTGLGAGSGGGLFERIGRHSARPLDRPCAAADSGAWAVSLTLVQVSEWPRDGRLNPQAGTRGGVGASVAGEAYP